MRIINEEGRWARCTSLTLPAFLVSFPDSAAISGTNLIDELNFY
jgi:hypothetical protein